jgi:hypothetical protein
MSKEAPADDLRDNARKGGVKKRTQLSQQHGFPSCQASP